MVNRGVAARWPRPRRFDKSLTAPVRNRGSGASAPWSGQHRADVRSRAEGQIQHLVDAPHVGRRHRPENLVGNVVLEGLAVLPEQVDQEQRGTATAEQLHAQVHVGSPSFTANVQKTEITQCENTTPGRAPMTANETEDRRRCAGRLPPASDASPEEPNPR